jgi:hypothetical protein
VSEWFDIVEGRLKVRMTRFVIVGTRQNAMLTVCCEYQNLHTTHIEVLAGINQHGEREGDT